MIVYAVEATQVSSDNGFTYDTVALFRHKEDAKNYMRQALIIDPYANLRVCERIVYEAPFSLIDTSSEQSP